jgi:cell wall-associated NlpC family hydrolase
MFGAAGKGINLVFNGDVAGAVKALNTLGTNFQKLDKKAKTELTGIEKAFNNAVLKPMKVVDKTFDILNKTVNKTTTAMGRNMYRVQNGVEKIELSVKKLDKVQVNFARGEETRFRNRLGRFQKEKLFVDKIGTGYLKLYTHINKVSTGIKAMTAIGVASAMRVSSSLHKVGTVLDKLWAKTARLRGGFSKLNVASGAMLVSMALYGKRALDKYEEMGKAVLTLKKYTGFSAKTISQWVGQWKLLNIDPKQGQTAMRYLFKNMETLRAKYHGWETKQEAKHQLSILKERLKGQKAAEQASVASARKTYRNMLVGVRRSETYLKMSAAMKTAPIGTAALRGKRYGLEDTLRNLPGVDTSGSAAIQAQIDAKKSELTKGLPQIYKDFEKLGLDPEKIVDLLDKGLKGNEKAFNMIIDRMAKIDPVKRTAYMVKLFGRQGASLVRWLDKTREEREKLAKEVRKAGLEWMEKDLNQFENYLDLRKRFQLQLEGLSIMFIKDVMPVIMKSINAFIKLTDAMKPIIPLLKYITIGLLGFIAAQKISIGLFAAMRLNPFIFGLTMIASVFLAIFKNSGKVGDNIKDKIIPLFNTFKDILDKLYHNLLKPIKKLFSTLFDPLVDAISTALGWLGTWSDSFKTNMNDPLNETSGFIGKIKKSLNELEPVAKKAGEWMSGAFNYLIYGSKTAPGGNRQGYSKMISQYMGTQRESGQASIFSTVSKYVAGAKKDTNRAGFIQKGFGVNVDKNNNPVDAILQAIYSNPEKYQGKGSKYIKFGGAGLAGFASQAGSEKSVAMDNLEDVFKGPIPRMVKNIQKLAAPFKDAFKIAGEVIKAVYDLVVGVVTSHGFKAAMDSLVALLTAVMKSISEVFGAGSGGMDSVVKVLTAFFSGVLEVVNVVLKAITAIVKALPGDALVSLLGGVGVGVVAKKVLARGGAAAAGGGVGLAEKTAAASFAPSLVPKTSVGIGGALKAGANVVKTGGAKGLAGWFARGTMSRLSLASRTGGGAAVIAAIGAELGTAIIGKLTESGSHDYTSGNKLGLGKQSNKKAKAQGRYSGEAITAGLREGIDSTKKETVEKIGSVATDGLNLWKTIFKIKSPSAVMNDMGQKINQGLALGISGSAIKVSAAMVLVGAAVTTIAKSTEKALQNTWARTQETADAAFARLSTTMAAMRTLGSGSGEGVLGPLPSGSVNGKFNVNVSQNAMEKLAKQQVGKPYVVGSSGPNQFDCSGLIQYLYKQYGISNFPTYTGNQIPLGKRVTNSSDSSWGSKIRFGDLIFFVTGIAAYTDDYGYGHVGMYIGNGQYIHASGSRTGVIISNLSERGGTWEVRRYFKWPKQKAANKTAATDRNGLASKMNPQASTIRGANTSSLNALFSKGSASMMTRSSGGSSAVSAMATFSNILSGSTGASGGEGRISLATGAGSSPVVVVNIKNPTFFGQPSKADIKRIADGLEGELGNRLYRSSIGIG